VGGGWRYSANHVGLVRVVGGASAARHSSLASSLRSVESCTCILILRTMSEYTLSTLDLAFTDLGQRKRNIFGNGVRKI
jgi:hypothetical protein